MGVVRIGGIHGVGKSKLINRALEISGISAPIIKGSTLMADFLNITPEQLPFINKAKRAEARAYMYEEFSKLTYGVRDGHFCIYSDQGYEYPSDENEKKYVVAAVIIISSALRILLRRKSIVRRRPLNFFKIVQQQRLEIMVAKKYAKKFNIPLHIVKNINFNKAAGELSEIFIKYL